MSIYVDSKTIPMKDKIHHYIHFHDIISFFLNPF